MFSIKDTQIDPNTKIDLSGYATTATTDKLTISIENLNKSVANKLNSNPVDHEHSISQITQLQEKLDNKLSIPSTDDNKYSYNALLKDWDSIPYLKDVKIPKLDITKDKSTTGYVFSVDSSTGNLLITHDDVIIAEYNKQTPEWIFGGTSIKEFIKTTNEVLKNHYDALELLINKFGLEDSDYTDGNKITPVSRE